MFNRILKIAALSAWLFPFNTSADIIIKNARLIDGTGADAVDEVTIVVSGDRIVSLDGAGADPGAQVIDAGGKTVMPGMIDNHMHSTMEYRKDEDGSYSMPVRFSWTNEEELTEFLRERFPGQMMDILETGVTTIVDTGAIMPYIVEVRDKVNAGEIVGPRMYVAGRVFTAPGGHPAGGVCFGDEWCSKNLSCATNSETVARQCVRNLVAAGVDGLKLAFDNAEGFIPGGIPKLKEDVMRAIIDEAHKVGVRTLTHTLTLDDTAIAAHAGTDGLAHSISTENGVLVTSYGESLPELLNRFDIPMITTVQFPPGRNTGPSLQALTRGGVDLLYGTDYPHPFEKPRYAPHMQRELRTLLAGGFSEMDIIQMLTGNSRRHPFTPEDYGTIEVGQLADIIIVDGDPLEDIISVTRPLIVIKGGKVMVDKR